MITADEKKRRMVESVALLASDLSVQQAVLPDWVVRADEIALIFDECYKCVGELSEQGELSGMQSDALQSIDQKLEAMSGQSNDALWTDAALASDPNWEWIREKAREALELLGAKPHTPRLDWLTFVR